MFSIKKYKIIGLDGLPILSNFYQGTGITKYIISFVNKLFEVDKENLYYIFLRMFKKNFFNLKKIKEYYSKYESVSVYPIFIPDKIQEILWNMNLASRIYRNIDLYISTCYFTPKFKKTFVFSFIYDITPLNSPAISLEYRKYFQKLISTTIKRSNFFLTISEYTKKTIMDKFNIPATQIEVLYPILGEIFEPQPRNKIEHLIKKYSINSKYILYVGIRSKNKNIVSAIKAFGLLVKKYNIPHKFVLVGRNDSSLIDKEIYEFCRENDIQEKVIILGYVPDTELAILYSGAELFVFPSLYEGFGMPLIEAMACGVPIVASNTSSIPEVVQDAGLLFNPFEIEEISDKMFLLLNDDELRKKIILKGLERAKFFRGNDSINKFIRIVKNL